VRFGWLNGGRVAYWSNTLDAAAYAPVLDATKQAVARGCDVLAERTRGGVGERSLRRFVGRRTINNKRVPAPVGRWKGTEGPYRNDKKPPAG